MVPQRNAGKMRIIVLDTNMAVPLIMAPMHLNQSQAKKTYARLMDIRPILGKEASDVCAGCGEKYRELGQGGVRRKGAVMSYDKKCWSLAEDFLQDEHDLNINKTNIHLLAQRIQDAIENWIEEARQHIEKCNRSAD